MYFEVYFMGTIQILLEVITIENDVLKELKILKYTIRDKFCH